MSTDESWLAVQVERALEAGHEAAMVDQGYRLMAQVELLRERAEQITELRTAKGKPMSESMRADLTEVLYRLERLAVLLEAGKW